VKTRQSMQNLNTQVIESLIKQGVNAITIQPSACITQNNKKIVSFETNTLRKFLELGVVPVLYGDMVIDKSLGASVVSGDAIISFLAKKLNAKKVLFGTDVKGVYDANPKKNPKAKLITRIGNKNLAKILEGTTGSSAVDVTQGMKGKLLEIRQNIRGKECLIFSLEKEKNLESILQGKKTESTKILFK
jgi:isopentenyl phosphate kinase